MALPFLASTNHSSTATTLTLAPDKPSDFQPKIGDLVAAILFLDRPYLVTVQPGWTLHPKQSLFDVDGHPHLGYLIWRVIAAGDKLWPTVYLNRPARWEHGGVRWILYTMAPRAESDAGRLRVGAEVSGPITTVPHPTTRRL